MIDLAAALDALEVRAVAIDLHATERSTPEDPLRPVVELDPLTVVALVKVVKAAEAWQGCPPGCSKCDAAYLDMKEALAALREQLNHEQEER